MPSMDALRPNLRSHLAFTAASALLLMLMFAAGVMLLVLGGSYDLLLAGEVAHISPTGG